MASKLHSGNGNVAETPETATKYEIRGRDSVENQRPVEAASAPEKEAKPAVGHPTLTELAPAAETTTPKKVTQSMQMPLVDVVNFIGVGETNCSNIGVTSGSIPTVEESKGSPNDNAFEIKGESHTTKQLIQIGIDRALTGQTSSRRYKLRRHRWSGHPHAATSPSAETSPPLAATETPKEPIPVDVPPELPQVQPATALKAKTGAFCGPIRRVVVNTPRVDQALTGHGHKKRHRLPPPNTTAASSGMGSSIKETKRNRYIWNDDIVKTFLDACIHEITINGHEDGGNLKPMSWKKVGETLKSRHNFSVDSKQMKSYFDGLKNKYKAWVSLKNKTPNIYNPSTNMFHLTDKEWETEIKKNKCIETLRKAPLRFPDLCAQLFDGGVDQALTKLSPLPATETPAKPQKEPIWVEVPPELPKVQPASALVAIETKSVFEDEILDVMKMIAEKINKPKPPAKPTFEDCEKKLNELGWASDDPLHLVALTIFCDENNNYRELWMKLNPDLCADWVRMIGRGKRFT